MFYTVEEMISNLANIYGEEHEHVISFKRLCENCEGKMEALARIAYDELMNRTD